MQTTIALNTLKLSKLNVRSATTSQGITELAASIEAVGLLAPLGVVKAKKDNHYEVIYGGRRLEALNALAKAGKIAKDHLVPCMIHQADEALRAQSLAENITREAMNPMDECRAFDNLVSKDKLTTTDVAIKFGVTERHVKQRLRLSNLEPVIGGMLACGKMSLDVAIAYATTDNHERQKAAFKQFGMKNHAIREIVHYMRDDVYTHDHERVKLVGKKDYLKAGGRIEEGLFDDVTTYLDVDLIEQLADAKIVAKKASMQKTLGVKAVELTEYHYLSSSETKGLVRLEGKRRPLTDEEKLEHARLTAELALLDEKNMNTDANDSDDDERYNIISERLDELHDQRSEISEADKATATAFVRMDRSGQMVALEHLYVPMTKTPKAISTVTEPAKTDDSCNLSHALADRRQQILGAYLANDPSLALDVTLFKIAIDILGWNHGNAGTGLNLRATLANKRIKDNDIDNTTAAEMLSNTRDTLNLEWLLPTQLNDVFLAYKSLSQTDKLNINAYCTAHTIEPSVNSGVAGVNRLHDLLGELMAIDVASVYRPGVADYWGKLSKDRLIATLTSWGGTSLVSKVAGNKRSEMADTCARLCNGTAIAEPDVLLAARHFVTPAMQFRVPDDYNTENDHTDGLDVTHSDETHSDASYSIDDDTDLTDIDLSEAELESAD